MATFGTPPRPHPAPRLPTAADRAVVWGIAAVAAIGAAVSTGSPTGWAPSDLVWRCLFAIVVVLAAARARRWTWLVLAGISATAAPTGIPVILSILALVIAFAASALDARSQPYSPMIGAAVGGLTIQVLLRLNHLEPTGTTALIVATATIPVLISGYRRSSDRGRRSVRWTVIGLAVFVGLATIGLATATLGARSDITSAINRAEKGFDAARDGEGALAAQRLRRSAASFGSAHDALTAPWALPARVVPILGQQAAAVETVTNEGAALAASASAAATDADIDQLKFEDGAIDLGLVASFEEPLHQAADALEVAAAHIDQVQSPWLVAPLASRLERFDDEVTGALPDARVAIQGVEPAPALLGGEGPRHYFIAFLTPSENRPLGGFMGSFGELTAIDGDLELTRSGSVEDVELPARANGATLTGPAEYLERYGPSDVADYMGDAGLSPDMPSVGQVLSELYPQAGGQPVDGVITVDPVALQALLNITGPISVTGYPEPLTADNAADVLLRQQYLTFDQRSVRKDFLEEATRKTFDALTSGDLPGPRQLTDVLGPMVDQGRLMVYADAHDEQAFMTQIGLDGAYPRPRGGDLIGLNTTNAANNKIDILMDRTLDYRVDYDPTTGAIEARAKIQITNNAPASGLPDVILSSGDRIRGGPTPLGTNGVNVSFYTPLDLDDATAKSVLGDGPQSMGAGREFGMSVYTANFRIPAGQTITLTLNLSGFIDPSETYRLTVANQPMVNPDNLTLTVKPGAGYTAEASDDFGVSDNVATSTVDTTQGDTRLRLKLTPG